MKIDSDNRTTALTGNTAPAPQGSKPAVQGKGSVQQDNVTLSSTSSQMQALEAGINKASGVDTNKVEAIRQAINEGSFTIKPDAIADKLIASTRELLAQQQS